VIWQFDLLIFALLIAAAIVAVRVRQLVATVAVLAIYSLLVALLFANMGAIDVAYVEAVLGSALSGVLLLITTLVTGNVRTRRSRKAEWVAIPAVLALVGMMLWATADLPDRGAADSPGAIGVAAEYLERSLEDTETPNVVTAILADYRSFDTLGEAVVVFTAALAVALVLTAALRRRTPTPNPSTPPGDETPGGPPATTTPGASVARPAAGEVR
jgi:multicomponent Na+:H+ antiporter subunit B